MTANEHRASFQGDENLLVLVLDQSSTLCIQARLRDTVGLVPDHHTKTNITIKRHTSILVSHCIQKLCLCYIVCKSIMSTKTMFRPKLKNTLLLKMLTINIKDH